MTDLRIVIPHYGPAEPLDVCMASLLKMEWHEPIARLLERHCVQIIDQNPPHVNRYFTWAINEGLRHCVEEWGATQGKSEMIVWLLNDDTEIDPQCALAAEKCFAEEGWDKCGIVGTRCVSMHDPDRIVWGGSLTAFPYGKHKAGSVAAGDLRLRTEEEWATFASVFVNARMVEEIGLLDKTLEHLCSDADYCFRARAAGWKVFYEPKAVVKHQVGTSRYCNDPVLNQTKTRDRMRFKAKWITGELFKRLTVFSRPEDLR
jgi:GT2 family glycosyltransferase